MTNASMDLSKVIEFHASIKDRIVSRENSFLEFKESFNWGAKSAYAKTIAAFANTKGGYIVFGVTNHPRMLKGISSSHFEDMDEEKITSYLNSIFSPEIIYNKIVIEINSKKLGIIQVIQSDKRPVVCIKNDGELKESDIYYRYIGRSERIKYPDLKLLLDDIRDTERKSWMEHLEKISKVGPTNAAVLNVLEGEITGSSGTLVIDKKLVPKLKFISQGSFKEGGRPVLKLLGDVKPVMVITKKGKERIVEAVRLTDDENAPAIKIDESEIRRNYPLDYTTLTDKLKETYSGFKANKKYHKIRRELMKDKKYCMTRYLDPTNVNSSRKDFYSEGIILKFRDYYNKKKNS